MLNSKTQLFSLESQQTRWTPIILVSLMAISGCSSLNTGDSSGGDGDYRTTEASLSKALEIPPNLIAPRQQKDDFYRIVDRTKGEAKVAEIIPTYQAKGLLVKSDLGERWLEMDTMDAEKVWLGLATFVKTMGFDVKSARRDVGLIETDFIPRKNIVPIDNLGTLTKLLNSWRTEFATGAFDRLIVRVEMDETTNKTRVYFYHSSIYSSMDAQDDTPLGNSKIRPSNPYFEAEALYQAMIFFGAIQADALQQIEMTENRIELTQDRTAFDGLKFKAGQEESWTYFKSMVYRMNWSIERMDANNYQAWVKLPDEVRKDTSITSRLAFWRDTQSLVLPEMVRFSLTAFEAAKGEPVSAENLTLLQVRSLEGETPLDEAQRKSIFQQLGLLNKATVQESVESN